MGRFKLNIRVTLFSAVFFVVFVNLGWWQLEREDEKRQILADREERLSVAPVLPLSLDNDEDLGGVRVRISGSFHEELIWLLDNRVLDGKVGFEVHHLFQDESGQSYLVNRGFVPMGRTREAGVDIPDIGSGILTVTGRIYQPGSEPLVLEEESLAASYPAIVQQIDVPALGKHVGDEFYPWVIRLDEGQPGSLPRYWPDTVMTPEQHLGYAIQWFTMALAVALVWLYFSYRNYQTEKRNEDTND